MKKSYNHVHVCKSVQAAHNTSNKNRATQKTLGLTATSLRGAGSYGKWPTH